MFQTTNKTMIVKLNRKVIHLILLLKVYLIIGIVSKYLKIETKTSQNIDLNFVLKYFKTKHNIYKPVRLI